MRTMSLAEARHNLSQIVDEVEGTHEAVTTTRDGRPSVVVVCVDDYRTVTGTLALLSGRQERERLSSHGVRRPPVPPGRHGASPGTADRGVRDRAVRSAPPAPSAPRSNGA
ncbi:type II toxin-antitoxin system Phd/YefM family antitoxin [Nocardiopsis dassonvillei subsp. albirubida]|uniref:Antitoxin n=1 Tax=Nocardiopsis alborubida TaxID=146802 RepID=A0A7X6RNL2_9ACTN|nr:type II toxin-antitoxin system Phd/YefM family antitoxin [Nocardiopsis alborubida]